MSEANGVRSNEVLGADDHASAGLVWITLSPPFVRVLMENVPRIID